MLKGVLPILILSVVSQADAYGYDLVGRLHRLGLEDLSAGTVYPLLTRLERQGLVAAYLRESNAGPARKYYCATPEGRRELAESVTQWQRLVDIVNACLTNTEPPKDPS
jgi:PadR family transcriptional regulator PadR